MLDYVKPGVKNFFKSKHKANMIALSAWNEGRKRVLAIVAGILAARMLAQFEGRQKVPATMSAIADADSSQQHCEENTMATCFCGEDLNERGECWQGKIFGGHQGNCVICGKNALLDGLRRCSVECGETAEVHPFGNFYSEL